MTQHSLKQGLRTWKDKAKAAVKKGILPNAWQACLPASETHAHDQAGEAQCSKVCYIFETKAILCSYIIKLKILLRFPWDDKMISFWFLTSWVFTPEFFLAKSFSSRVTQPYKIISWNSGIILSFLSLNFRMASKRSKWKSKMTSVSLIL